MESAGPLDTDLDEVHMPWCDPELERAVLALAGGDPTPAFDLLTVTRDQPDRRELCAEALGEAGTSALPVLRRAAEERRDDADRLLLWGSALNAAAWRARGAAYAEHTTEEQFGQLIDLTRQSRATLRRAAALAPDDAGPWSQLMWAALGAPEHETEGEEVFTEVLRRSPDLYGAQLARLQMLTPKWYGSREEMLAHARARVAGLPPGHPLLALMPFAHIEIYLEVITSGNIFKRMWRSAAYLDKKDVRAEVLATSDLLLAGAEVYRSHPRSMMAHQVFAMFYLTADNDLSSKSADKARIARHLVYSGDRPAELPWAYFGNPGEQFAKARKAAAKAS